VMQPKAKPSLKAIIRQRARALGKQIHKPSFGPCCTAPRNFNTQPASGR
jgi:hypothetical protein